MSAYGPDYLTRRGWKPAPPRPSLFGPQPTWRDPREGWQNVGWPEQHAEREQHGRDALKLDAFASWQAKAVALLRLPWNMSQERDGPVLKAYKADEIDALLAAAPRTPEARP